MNLNDKLKQERTGLTASQYSDLQELFVDRYVDGMTTKDLVEYVYNDMMQYVESQPEQEFLDDCKDYWDDAYDEIIQEIKELDKEGDIDVREQLLEEGFVPHDTDDYGSKVDALVDSMSVTDEEVSTKHRRRDLDTL